MNTEKKIRPSSLPAMAECPQFEGDGKESDHAAEGTRRHSLLAAFNTTGKFENEDGSPINLTEESQEAVKWASEYIDNHKVGDGVFEKKIAIALNVEGQTVTIEGTPDCRDGLDNGPRNLFDLKWRFGNYRPQLAAYALGIMQDAFTEKIKVHILFGYDKKPQTFTLTEDEAEAEIVDIVGRVIREEPANPCEYCGWCGKAASCPALAERVEAVRSGRDDWGLDSYHASEIESPVEMAKALDLARALKKWCEAIEYHAKQMLLKKGSLPGFKLSTRAGKKRITDLAQAVVLSGLDPDEFIKVCSVAFGDLKALHQATFGEDYTSKAAADRDLLKKLEPVIETGSEIHMILKDRPQKK